MPIAVALEVADQDATYTFLGGFVARAAFMRGWGGSVEAMLTD
jgi:hypothetical protein